ncbi:GNAT family N-acetyltransferase [Variovorax sp. UMC13]|uniref:GNAT family N-acetyltransferase n=1 Tax=Variovorax sp. UMC13 TaxID=1862326 RepID=UPI0016031546|nr:GNAT family N-acetyltransferase [Variovorax sp. UMC13]
MVSTELDAPVHVVETLGALDRETLAMLDALVVQSGWNQTAEDWGLFSQQGTLFAVRDGSGCIVASGAVLPMGDTGAWISMILVAPALRGQGLGRTVFEQCLREVRRQGRVALLDATPAGERLYTQYGFSPLWRLTRWQRAAAATSTALARQEATGLAQLAALDAEALGLARGEVLAHLAGRAGSRLQRHAQGFAIVRAGRIAHQIGPLIATDEAAAARLLAEIAEGTPEPLIVDVPDMRAQLRAQLAAAGLTPQRGFVRMALGEPVPHGQTAFLHAIAGPEYG